MLLSGAQDACALDAVGLVYWIRVTSGAFVAGRTFPYKDAMY
jgi:hypothetical protein